MLQRIKKFFNIRRLLASAGIILILYDCIPLAEPLFEPVYNYEVQDSAGRTLRVFLSDNEEYCLPPAESELPEKLVQAVVNYEDRYYFRHPGINPVSMMRAVVTNIEAGKIQSGASTIPMQVARLMKPKARTFPNKLLEVAQAVKLSIRHSKQEILHLYLNHAPYGGNIRGIRAAALRYYGKAPSELTWGEAAALAVIPNAPGLVSPLKNRDQLLNKRNRLLHLLFERGKISAEALGLSLAENVPDTLRPFPFRAPHLSRNLVSQRGDSSFLKRSTVQGELQARIEELVKDHSRTLRTFGIHDAAVLVAETGSGKIRAYVGSPDFLDDRGGQVDGVSASRSSGSLLKPLLWAACMDAGLCLPQTRIKDIPTYYGSFSPSNYSGGFDGLVRSDAALIRSLNVPAVRLLYTYGVQPFSLLLKHAGLTTLSRPSEYYGLSLILGGAEITLLDIAGLYRGLARGGRFEPLIFEEGTPTADSDEIISPGSCYLVLETLKKVRRPGAEYYWEQFQNQWPIAWKTGTSYGHKDGWAVGVSPEWTIAVWTGNFNGEGNANLTGASCAAPLLFDIFNSLKKNARKAWFQPPHESLTTVTLCKETGFIAGPCCDKTEKAVAPLNMQPLQVCPYHQRIAVSHDGSHTVCSLCWKPDHYQLINRCIFPPQIAQFLRDRGQNLWQPPPHTAGCPGHETARVLSIVYPVKEAEIWIPRELGGRLQRLTCRAAHSDTRSKIHWYLDDRYMGTTVEKHTLAINPQRGWHELTVVDQRGNRDTIRFHAGYENENEKSVALNLKKAKL